MMSAQPDLFRCVGDGKAFAADGSGLDKIDGLFNLGIEFLVARTRWPARAGAPGAGLTLTRHRRLYRLEGRMPRARVRDGFGFVKGVV